MPTIAVTDAGVVLPARSGRRLLIMRNEGANACRIGFEPVVTNDGTAATDGLLFPHTTTLELTGKDLDLSGALTLRCAATQTTTVSYTERT